MKNQVTIEEHLDTKYKDYAYYVVEQRAIPRLRDGLKNVQRRALYVAKDSAKSFVKVNTLAGQVLPYHPHGDISISDAIGKLAQDFPNSNNYPLFEGKGAFGSKLSGPGNGIGAARYVSVKLSDIAKKLLFVDEELIDMVPNYDGLLKEPENFLPLIPVCLYNGIRGVAVGYATNIPSYNIKDIIKLQKKVLNLQLLKNTDIPLPYYGKDYKGKIYRGEDGKIRSLGNFEINKNELRITELPIGYNREQYVKVLDKLEEQKKINDYEDYSKKTFDFRIKLRRGNEYTDSKIIELFKLEKIISENLVLIDTNGKLKQYENILEIIEEFTTWRFKFYHKRYLLLKQKLEKQTEYNYELKKFIKFVLDNNYLNKMSKLTKIQIHEDLKNKFKFLDKLLNISIYNFSLEKINELEKEIQKDEKQIKEYEIIINDESKQKEIFINELEELKL